MSRFKCAQHHCSRLPSKFFASLKNCICLFLPCMSFFLPFFLVLPPGSIRTHLEMSRRPNRTSHRRQRSQFRSWACRAERRPEFLSFALIDSNTRLNDHSNGDGMLGKQKQANKGAVRSIGIPDWQKSTRNTSNLCCWCLVGQVLCEIPKLSAGKIPCSKAGNDWSR